MQCRDEVVVSDVLLLRIISTNTVRGRLFFNLSVVVLLSLGLCFMRQAFVSALFPAFFFIYESFPWATAKRSAFWLIRLRVS